MTIDAGKKMSRQTRAALIEIREQLGEAVHTSLRKGSSHPKAHEAWKAISAMPNKEWGSVIDFLCYGLGIDDESLAKAVLPRVKD